ncbi:unnamed protein product [Cochlearia groenlandica]
MRDTMTILNRRDGGESSGSGGSGGGGGGEAGKVLRSGGLGGGGSTLVVMEMGDPIRDCRWEGLATCLVSRA